MSQDVNRCFGQAVRRMRQQRRWTQEFLAERTNLNRNFLSLVERGARSPTLNTVARLAKGLDMSIAELMYACQFDDDAELPLRPAGDDPAQ